MQLSPEQDMRVVNLATRIGVTKAEIIDCALTLLEQRKLKRLRGRKLPDDIPRMSRPPAELDDPCERAWRDGFSDGVYNARHRCRKSMWEKCPYMRTYGAPPRPEDERRIDAWVRGYKDGEKRVLMMKQLKNQSSK